MPNTYACKGVSNPNVPIFLPRVCTLVLFIVTGKHAAASYNYTWSITYGLHVAQAYCTCKMPGDIPCILHVT